MSSKHKICNQASSSVEEAGVVGGNSENEDTTLFGVVRGLLQDNVDSGVWSQCIELYYGTPLAALLDFELAKINHCIVAVADSLGLGPNMDKLPVAKWSGVVFECVPADRLETISRRGNICPVQKNTHFHMLFFGCLFLVN